MREEAFVPFAEASIASYAADSVQAGRWPASGALAHARADFERLLPQGLQTPGHRFCEIRDEIAMQMVGALWFQIVETAGARHAYVYNIRVQPEFRGRGHAKAALDLLEPIALAEGASRVALHVFAFNTSAHALYRSLGYGICGFNMLKSLRREGD
jgi:ribosomal protein S18 acetylase RimI-like enzyme